MPGPPRLLLPLTYGLSVRYALPTGLISDLSRRADVIVGLSWEDPELATEIGAAGAQVVALPDPVLSHEYRMFRRRLTALRDRRLSSPTTAVRTRRQREALPDRRALAIDQVRRWRDRALVATASGAAAAEAAESAEVEAGTNASEFRAFLDAHEIDAVLSLTPYHEADALLLWAARGTGRRDLTSVISFDNPTTRERLLVRSTPTLVWNRYNREELCRSYPDLAADDVVVTGAPQFDLHRRPELVMPRSMWSAEIGAGTDQPVILYGAGPVGQVPHEHRLVEMIDDAISSGSVAGRPYLLVRRHPADPPGSWDATAAKLRNGRVVDPWAHGPGAFRSWPSGDDIELQMSTLAHSDVHVNVCSSMSLDGAVFDRPQICPVFVPGAGESLRRRFESFYRQEHWQPLRRSGALSEAADEAALTSALTDSLRDPGRARAARRRMVADVLTFTDGESTRRVVDAVQAALRDDAPPRPGVSS
jgi:hypothetical protein